MSFLDESSVLIPNRSYKVQDISKLGKDTKRFIGKPFIYLYTIGQTAHGRAFGNMHTVPVRSLINIKGYVAKGVQSKNADGFVVIAQNNLNLPIGQAYLDPLKVTDTHAYFEINGKEIKVSLDILASLVKIKEKITKESKKLVRESGIELDIIETLDTPINRMDLENPLPSFIEKMFPNLNAKEVINNLSKKENVFSDYEGNLHTTFADADKANTLLRHKYLTEFVKDLASKEVEAQMQAIAEKVSN